MYTAEMVPLSVGLTFVLGRAPSFTPASAAWCLEATETFGFGDIPTVYDPTAAFLQAFSLPEQVLPMYLIVDGAGLVRYQSTQFDSLTDLVDALRRVVHECSP